jgi:hypothetical protein
MGQLRQPSLLLSLPDFLISDLGRSRLLLHTEVMLLISVPLIHTYLGEWR